ncbi:MAG TPA: VOC family protein [Bacteroidia bacterium]|jgi:uncharacterized glyoxalase superfamily protein PhnB|nr:VOC family protein [Bacteroidia bacterium]
MKLQKLTVNLMVENVDRSVKFYSDLLGFTTITSVPGEKGMIFALIMKDEVSIMLQTLESFVANNPEFKNEKTGGAILLYIDVKNIDEVFERVKKAKVGLYKEMHETFYGTKEFAIRDPDGYLISFAEDQK